jgi:dGTPase
MADPQGSTLDDRFHSDDKPPDQRSPFQRDRDRILYSTALRRLAGITQVVSPTDRSLVHNRLTHTLEVAQIARRLAEKLVADADPSDGVRVDPDVAEAAALAHDLGHPPFGHVTEEVLDDLALETKFLEGFNGNAQSFRIVTKLSVRHQGFPGLNLTRSTLDAILKYPWMRQAGGKGRARWGAYQSESDEFRWTRARHSTGSDTRSIEAEIMDWADDIAYAVHDMEDFYRAGLIPLPALITDTGERDRFLQGAFDRLQRHSGTSYSEPELEEAFRDVIVPLPTRSPFHGSRDQEAGLHFFTSVLIGRYLNAFSLIPNGPSGYTAQIDPLAKLHVSILKQLTWHYVIESPVLAAIQFGQRRLIRYLFEAFQTEAFSRTSSFVIFPELYREQLREEPAEDIRNRLVIDLIASMTEQQALDMYLRLTGLSADPFADWH